MGVFEKLLFLFCGFTMGLCVSGWDLCLCVGVCLCVCLSAWQKAVMREQQWLIFAKLLSNRTCFGVFVRVCVHERERKGVFCTSRYIPRKEA